MNAVIRGAGFVFALSIATYSGSESAWAAEREPGQTGTQAPRASADAGIAFSLRSVRDGKWSEPQTWKPARVPRAGDRVLVDRGTRVVYDVESEAVLRLLQVVGTLSFARDRDTLLNVGVLKVQNSNVCSESGFACDFLNVNRVGEPVNPPKGHMPLLEVGSRDKPIPPEHTARIRLHYLPGTEKDDAPAIACCSARMEIHGAPMSRTWVDLGATAEPDDRTVTLSEAVTGWRVGDDVIITGSKRVRGSHGVRRDDPEAVSTERRRIKAMDGKRITLDRPLTHTHDGKGDYRSEVANLSRNVVIESADPDGVRAHTVYHRFSRGSISYARFAHLGKEGVLGGYAIHFHLVGNTMRGASVVGAAIVDSHNRWITVHGTNYMVVRDCVGYRSVGHGFFLEDGTEVYNVFDRNLGVHAYAGEKLPNQVMPFDPNDGAAFWWSNGRNTFVRNTACENNRYGFRYDSQKRSNFDTNLPVMMPDGEEREIDIRSIPFYRFEDNESHTEGLYGATFAGTNLIGPDRRHPHVVRNLTVWNSHYAFRPQLPTMLIENVRINGATYGIYRAEVDHHVYRNVHLAGLRNRAVGFAGRADGHGRGGIQHGPFTYDGLTIADSTIKFPFVCMNMTSPEPAEEAHFRNVTIKDARSPRNIVDIQPAESGLAGTTQNGLTYYFHDTPTDGHALKVVAKRFSHLQKDAAYHPLEGFTGEHVVATKTKNVAFPKLLDPVDDVPPATVMTWPADGSTVKLEGGTLLVRGTTTDNTKTKRVVVGGVDARDVDHNFHRWEAKLTGIEPGKLTITAFAEDESGNVEKRPHEIHIVVR